MNTAQIKELITRRRKQILVHSVIYYRMDSNIISDDKWNEWARELCRLQNQYPDIAEECIFADEFKDFDPASGFDLPLENTWANNKALQLIAYEAMMTK